jgi:hypothetical protein
MRKIEVKFFDDLDWTYLDKTLTTAAVTVTVGLDGVWRELDLSDPHNTEVREQLGRWMRAGRVPGSEEVTPAGKRLGRPPGTQRTIAPETLAEGKAMRAFANEHGIRYITKAGKYYYSVKLREAWDRHKAELDRAELEERASANGN